jgi:hypothetical protein
MYAPASNASSTALVRYDPGGDQLLALHSIGEGLKGDVEGALAGADFEGAH